MSIAMGTCCYGNTRVCRIRCCVKRRSLLIKTSLLVARQQTLAIISFDMMSFENVPTCIDDSSLLGQSNSSCIDILESISYLFVSLTNNC